MSVPERQPIPLAEAEAIADDIVALLKPYTERIQVAGSIRRRKPMVKDIEICAIPAVDRWPIDLFETEFAETDLLHAYCERLLAEGTLAKRLDINDRPRWGQRVKYAWYQTGGRLVALDLFVTTPAQWGLILMIRTGPGEFNMRWVRQKLEGGAILPFGMRVADGWLWRHSEKLQTPEERDVFNAIGLDYLEPWDRT